MDIKALRLSNNLSRQQLAEKIGVKMNTVTGYELGRIKPSVKVAKQLGKTFDVAWQYFLE